jgi:hypothetical protein
MTHLLTADERDVNPGRFGSPPRDPASPIGSCAVLQFPYWCATDLARTPTDEGVLTYAGIRGFCCSSRRAIEPAS